MKPGVKNHIRKNTMREKAWKVMRTLGNYTLTEVAVLSAADYENIRHYHQCLVNAGYVKQVGKKKQEGRTGFDKVYRLIKNTGPKPPIQKSLRFLFDPNISEYWAADPELMAQAISANVVPSPETGIKKICIHVKPGSFLDRIENGSNRSSRLNSSNRSNCSKGGCHVD